MTPTITSSAWVPEALATVRIMSGWQKMMMGIAGPRQILNPWGYLATSWVKSRMPFSVDGYCKQGKSHHSFKEATAADSVWDSAQMEGTSASSFPLGERGSWSISKSPRIYPRAQEKTGSLPTGRLTLA